jgi:hypothetical protein
VLVSPGPVACCDEGVLIVEQEQQASEASLTRKLNELKKQKARLNAEDKEDESVELPVLERDEVFRYIELYEFT